MASLSYLLCCLLVFLYLNTRVLAAAEANESEIDRQSLLCFKSGIYSDPHDVLSTWRNTSLNFCNWQGVSCSTRPPARVVSLNLTSAYLSGWISGCIANLTGLRTLMLAGNNLEGNIPDSLGSSMSLSYVDLANNSLSGHIPHSFTSSSSISTLILSRNKLTGDIPATLFANSSILTVVNLQQNSLTGDIPPFGKVTALNYLCITENFLSGSIPPSVGNVSSLRSLWLGQNKFTGSIPESLSDIPKLLELDLSVNGLSGYVPLSLYNMSSLIHLSLGGNDLVGQLPSDIGHTLPNLQIFNMQGNNLEGLIPASLKNVSNLQVLDLSNNSLHGRIPSLGSLANLSQVRLGRNRLGHDWIFFASLTNCSCLKILSLEENMLKGSLPRSVCNLSTSLDSLLLGSNQISGSIPVEISNLVNLTELSIEKNLLSGSIPATIGKMRNLCILNLSKNKLSGEIPSTVGSITELRELFLDDNNLGGTIPSSLGQCMRLSQLNLSANNLNGSIPEELFFSLPSLLSMDFSHNNLMGEVPMGCKSTGLVLLNVSNNLLSGQLPPARGCSALLSHSIEGNKLQGQIPATFNWLRSIRYINLSRNYLSGNLPEFIENLTMLDQLDLSYNNFEGPIPTRGIFANSTMVHLNGNKRLCSNFSIQELPPCPGTSDTKNHKSSVPFLPVLVPTVTIAFLLLLSCLFTLWRKMDVHMSTLHIKIWYLLKLVTHWSMRQVCAFPQFIRSYHIVTQWRREQICIFPQLGMVRNVFCFLTLRRRKEVEICPTYPESLKRVSYGDIAKATKWFSPDHRISSTRTGSVYVGRLQFASELVAIKVFNLNKHAVHEAECEVLRRIRHRNILKPMTSCSTWDTENNEFKALVFRFMANGSLARWLHPKQEADKPTRTLSLGQRICIVTDVACALDYLHNQLSPPLVHCNLKPENVLLDHDFTARVGDFGLAKFLLQDSGCLQHLVRIQGTIGYLAPDYGVCGRITTRSDVYSFGVLLLEMLTGKRPTDEMFVDGLNLHNVTDSMFPDRVAEILDPHMKHEEHQVCDEVWMQRYIIPLVALGLACSMDSPKDRPGMQDVCAKLHAIKEAFLESCD
ncbi:hypothetical protein BS78_10G068900 [Paspalum vaginatum]|nr:hypothetical protein BS78_10G068900 [Paspalum vaginatum]KAJ1258355.1 hypothetical protein BS78_10G068900 [Paspalum vaginatum]